MHVSKDSMWRKIWKILQNFLGTKQGPISNGLWPLTSLPCPRSLINPMPQTTPKFNKVPDLVGAVPCCHVCSSPWSIQSRQKQAYHAPRQVSSIPVPLLCFLFPIYTYVLNLSFRLTENITQTQASKTHLAHSVSHSSVRPSSLASFQWKLQATAQPSEKKVVEDGQALDDPHSPPLHCSWFPSLLLYSFVVLLFSASC
jgi:hypothetical protein